MAKVRCQICRCKFDAKLVYCPLCGHSWIRHPRTIKQTRKKRGIIGTLFSWLMKFILGIAIVLFIAENILFALWRPSSLMVMEKGIGLAEKQCEQIIEVWDNSQNKVNDPATDKYTMKDGVFVESEEALKNLYEDQTFKGNLQKIKDNQEKADLDVGAIQGLAIYDDDRKDIQSLFESYMQLTNLPSEQPDNLETFKDRYKKLDAEVHEKYEKVK